VSPLINQLLFVGGASSSTPTNNHINSNRAARLGYSVLAVDTDVVWFRNPYTHLKSPLFA